MKRLAFPRQIRQKIRKGLWAKPTSGLAPGYAQANLVILDQRYAFDFLLFCQRNPNEERSSSTNLRLKAVASSLKRSAPLAKRSSNNAKNRDQFKILRDKLSKLPC